MNSIKVMPPLGVIALQLLRPQQLKRRGVQCRSPSATSIASTAISSRWKVA